MSDPDAAKAKKIIEENIYMTVATASRDGQPWISPVFFAYDENYKLFWVSDKNSRHSELIRNNPQVAIVIFDSSAPEGEGDGVYFKAEAYELEDKTEIEQAVGIYNNRATQDEFRFKRVEDVTGEAAWRIYKAVPQKVYTLTEGEYINGQYVDKKMEVDLLKSGTSTG